MKISTIPPYQEALEIIDRHTRSSQAISLAKLVLSLWNADCAFSFRECISNLDPERTDLALRMVQYFVQFGEDDHLTEIGHEMFLRYPDLWAQAVAADSAKLELMPTWDVEAKHK